jgi:hypothetical protein
MDALWTGFLRCEGGVQGYTWECKLRVVNCSSLKQLFALTYQGFHKITPSAWLRSDD